MRGKEASSRADAAASVEAVEAEMQNTRAAAASHQLRLAHVENSKLSELCDMLKRKLSQVPVLLARGCLLFLLLLLLLAQHLTEGVGRVLLPLAQAEERSDSGAAILRQERQKNIQLERQLASSGSQGGKPSSAAAASSRRASASSASSFPPDKVLLPATRSPQLFLSKCSKGRSLLSRTFACAVFRVTARKCVACNRTPAALVGQKSTVVDGACLVFVVCFKGA
jgi:hypothetical protein